MAVNLQFTVLQSAVKYIKTVGNPDSEHLSHSLPLSFEDHHAIFQKHKSIAGKIFNWTIFDYNLVTHYSVVKCTMFFFKVLLIEDE